MFQVKCKPRFGENAYLNAMIHPRTLLVIWVVFLAVTILVDVQPEGPQKSPDNKLFELYADVLLPKPMIYAPFGGTFLSLDIVRGIFISPFIHPERKIAFVATTVVFLLILLFSTYFSAKRLDDGNAGIIAALCLGACPFVMASSRVYDHHVPLLAVIQVTLAFLFHFYQSQKIQNLLLVVAALLFGLFICTYQTDYLFFVLCLAAPLTWVIGSGLLKSGRRWLHLAAGLVFLAVLLIAPIWAFLRLNPLENYVGFGGVLDFFFGRRRIDTSVTVLNNPRILMAYLQVLWQATLSWPLNLFVFLGFVVFAIQSKRSGFWLAAVLFPLLVMTISPKRNMYYVASILPALSVSAAVGLNRLFSRWHTGARVAFFVCAVALNLAFAYGCLEPGAVLPKWRAYFVVGKHQYLPHYDNITLEPVGSSSGQEDYFAKRISKRVLRDQPRPLAIGYIGRLCGQMRLNVELLWRGIYSRDLLCDTGERIKPSVYDAIVVLPVYRHIPEVFDAESIGEISDFLESALAQGRELYPGFERERLSSFSRERKFARQSIPALSDVFSKRIVIDDHVVFVRP